MNDSLFVSVSQPTNSLQDTVHGFIDRQRTLFPNVPWQIAAIDTLQKETLVDSNGLGCGDVLQCGNTGKTEVSEDFSPFRRGGRAADCTGLENRRRRKAFVGSNPSPSARRASSLVVRLRHLNALRQFSNVPSGGTRFIRRPLAFAPIINFECKEVRASRWPSRSPLRGLPSWCLRRKEPDPLRPLRRASRCGHTCPS